MSKSETIAVYESVLEGALWPKNFFSYATKNHRISEIVSYIFEKENIKSVEEAYDILTDEFISKYKLEMIIKISEKPSECYSDDYSYLAWYAFPDEVPDEQERIRGMVDNIISGKRSKLPSKYFLKSENASNRAIFIFKYICEDKMQLNKEQIKDIFGKSSGIKVLGKYKMRALTSVVFPSLQHLLLAAYPDIFKENK